MADWLSAYEELEIIGNGSFGIIRKVRRKSDGVILARKELNYSKMNERDRKQTVAEVNILKDLCHDNIVKYVERHIDAKSHILYIVMEYCSGGDLSSIIKTASRKNSHIPEDTIWLYFTQLLQALKYCHSSIHSFKEYNSDGSEKPGNCKGPILHRDLKPDNVFLGGDSPCIKLGDFGLSKTLSAATFANTYVGTPYYMSPEVIQEKSYDSKSDIWSLGCLMYELCALRPPFQDARNLSELAAMIRSGRVAPIPRMYSAQLSKAISSMLNVNPAARPSASQLLVLDRVTQSIKAQDAERIMSQVTAARASVFAKEQKLLAKESAFREREAHYEMTIAHKDAEIDALHHQMNEMRNGVEHLVHQAVAEKEAVWRSRIIEKENEAMHKIALREEELQRAVAEREAQLTQAWIDHESNLRRELDELFEDRLAKELAKAKADSPPPITRQPLDDLKNTPLSLRPKLGEKISRATRSLSRNTGSAYKTPLVRRTEAPPASAMKGVVLTATGEPLATPTPAELASLFQSSPVVQLKFSNIFEKSEDSDDETPALEVKQRASLKSPPIPETPGPTRLRRPSISSFNGRPASFHGSPTVTASAQSLADKLSKTTQSSPTAAANAELESMVISPVVQRRHSAAPRKSTASLRVLAATNNAASAKHTGARRSVVGSARP